MVTLSEDGARLPLASLEPKQVSVIYIRIEEGLLYTNICQALMFDQPYSSAQPIIFRLYQIIAKKSCIRSVYRPDSDVISESGLYIDLIQDFSDTV